MSNKYIIFIQKVHKTKFTHPLPLEQERKDEYPTPIPNIDRIPATDSVSGLLHKTPTVLHILFWAECTALAFSWARGSGNAYTLHRRQTGESRIASKPNVSSVHFTHSLHITHLYVMETSCQHQKR
jgi:hypothetical protein